MSTKLTNAIVEHIFDELGITAKQAVPITSNEFLTEHTISYTGDNGSDVAKVWACEATINNAKIVMAHTAFRMGDNDKDYALVVDIQDCPLYGCYLSMYDYDSHPYKDGLITFSLRPKKKSEENAWIETTNYLQATFLAGMENLRDLMVSYSKPKDTNDIFKVLLSFVKHCDDLQEEE